MVLPQKKMYVNKPSTARKCMVVLSHILAEVWESGKWNMPSPVFMHKLSPISSFLFIGPWIFNTLLDTPGTPLISNLPRTVLLLLNVPIYIYNKIRYMKLYLICIANICIYFDERQYYYNIVYFKLTVAVMKKGWVFKTMGNG